FSAGALGALGHKEWIAEQIFQQQGFDFAAGSPLAVTIKVVAALLVYPRIQQNIPRATVETGYRFTGLDQAEIAEAANVQHGSVTGPLFKQGFVKGWYQWCSLTASSNIATAEVADHGDTGQLSEQGGVADLYREPARRFVANGLAMAADRTNVRGFQVLLSKKRVNTLCRKFHPTLLSDSRAGNLVRTAGAQAKQLGAQGC